MSFPKHLLEGYRTFTSQRLPTEQTRYRELSERGQSPAVMVIGCCDSRVSPEVIFDAGPGELFVVRNVANLVPPYETTGRYHGTSAALEFAVCNLNVSNIIVLGHSRCGGIRALLEGYGRNEEGEGFIAPWVQIAAPARDEVLRRWPDASSEFKQRACERAGIRTSLMNLMTFPFIRQRVEDGRVKLYGWYYDLENGELMQYDPDKDRFYDMYFGPMPADIPPES
jgi:carbonic anhydrase